VKLYNDAGRSVGADAAYRTDFAIMLRDRNGDTRVTHDYHIEGLFPRGDWVRLLSKRGSSRTS
jgi:hypothetical protein